MKQQKLVFILLLCSIATVLSYTYYKYEKYLPTLHLAAPTQTLTEHNIHKIRTETPITEVKVYKAERKVQLLHNEQIIRSYVMRLGFDPLGHKIKEGDGKTPEGRYWIDWRNSQSAFYKSLHISYPNTQDIAKAKELGVSTGGDIMIHGSASNKQLQKLPMLMQYMPRNDWTWGCIAVRNIDMDEIWKLVDNHTPIEIYP
ncbi:L,D-transpeptidase family protein [Acinetobacter silvestris]|uniref:L,D-transpeptidase catalytic domain protein n=1 Tax=Acinetobacter silvestris TaxID=1977882 RepID=A0A1Y3CL68_9GAMM|nr:L,D-transpeptidase family protein [Acinetobacter silvestris]OTG67332.1 L,D-transpeptidase catalytic domain protein [Acinetobacter silvestris]